MATSNASPGDQGHTVLHQIKARIARARWRAAMMRAIDAACEPSEIWGYANRTDGLRAIKALERLTAKPFDPFDPVLVHVVRGTGPRYRRLRLS